MASSLNASTSGGGGVIVTSDATGNLNIQSGGSTVVAVTAAGASVTGTLAATGAITGSSTVAGSTGILYPLTSSTAVTLTTQTSVDFTSIPSWVKRITVMFNGASGNAGSNKLIQIGSGSVDAASYISSGVVFSTAGSTGANFTTGYGIFSDGATYALSGQMVITLITGNTWVASYVFGGGTALTGLVMYGGGTKTLSGTLDRIRLTTVNGTDTFDAGSVNLLYE